MRKAWVPAVNASGQFGRWDFIEFTTRIAMSTSAFASDCAAWRRHERVFVMAGLVQNTKKGERVVFEWLKPFAPRSGLIPFEGRYQEKGRSKRAAICIGRICVKVINHFGDEVQEVFVV